MDIKSYEVIIESEHCNKQILYRGNENIIFRQKTFSSNEEIEMRIPRDILEKFVELIR